MQYKEWLKNETSEIKYALFDVDNTKIFNTLDHVYSDVTFSDIFQQTNCDYLIFIVNKECLISLFNSYLDSFYDFRTIIPWLKIDYTESSLLNVTQKLKNCMDFVVIFQRPHVRNIKALLQTIIIEPEKSLCFPEWQKNLILEFFNISYSGIYVSKDGQVVDSNQFIQNSTVQNKIQLF